MPEPVANPKWEKAARELHAWLRREAARMERSKNHGAGFDEIASAHLAMLRDHIRDVERLCQEISH